MNIAFEVISALALGDGASVGAFQPVGSDSFRVRDAKKAELISVWACSAAAVPFIGGIRSSLLHDAQVGIQTNVGAQAMSVVNTFPGAQPLVPQDDLRFDGAVTTAAAQGDMISMAIRYEDLGGVDGQFLSPKDIHRRVESIYSPLVQLSAPTAGSYGPSVLVNALEDQLKANREYAVLGVFNDPFQGAAAISHIGVTSVDWGNLRIGIPVGAYFASLSVGAMSLMSDQSGVDMIPVFNSSNKENTTFDIIGPNAALSAVNVVVTLALLKKSSRR